MTNAIDDHFRWPAPGLPQALLVSGLLHLAAVSPALFRSPPDEARMAGSPVFSVSLVNTPEAHRPQSKPQPRKPEPKEAVKPLEQPTETTLKDGKDAVESPASVSAETAVDAEHDSISQARFDADYLNNPKPQYPAMSRRLGEQGRVILHVQVSTDGKPLQVTVKASSGYTRLDHAALEVVKQWEFVPAKQGEQTLMSWVDVPLQFSLVK